MSQKKNPFIYIDIFYAKIITRNNFINIFIFNFKPFIIDNSGINQIFYRKFHQSNYYKKYIVLEEKRIV